MIPSMDGKKMNAVETDPNGVVNQETIFHFNETDGAITAEYAGGRVKHGYLVGKIIEEKLAFQYTQLHEDGKMAGGHSVCDIEVLSDGSVRLVEHFVWDDGVGTNVLEELS